MEEAVHQIEDGSRFALVIYGGAKLRPAPHAVREIGGKLLHFSDGVPLVARDEHIVIPPHHNISVVLRRFIIGAGFEILRNLPEDPRIVRRGAADHDGVALGFAHHADGVFRRDDPLTQSHTKDLFTNLCGPGTEHLYKYLPGGPFPDIESFTKHLQWLIDEQSCYAF